MDSYLLPNMIFYFHGWQYHIILKIRTDIGMRSTEPEIDQYSSISTYRSIETMSIHYVRL